MATCRKPCRECPFSRTSVMEGDKLGGSDPTVYIGQSMGPFWLPCHMDSDYKGKESDHTSVLQCAGAAIYRSNVQVPYKLPDALLKLPSDPETVFASHAEFLAHHRGITLSQAEMELYITTPVELMEDELKKEEVRFLSHQTIT